MLFRHCMLNTLPSCRLTHHACRRSQLPPTCRLDHGIIASRTSAMVLHLHRNPQHGSAPAHRQGPLRAWQHGVGSQQCDGMHHLHGLLPSAKEERPWQPHHSSAPCSPCTMRRTSRPPLKLPHQKLLVQHAQQLMVRLHHAAPRSPVQELFSQEHRPPCTNLLRPAPFMPAMLA